MNGANGNGEQLQQQQQLLQQQQQLPPSDVEQKIVEQSRRSRMEMRGDEVGHSQQVRRTNPAMKIPLGGDAEQS